MNQKQIMRRYGRELFLSSIAYAALLVTSIIVLQRFELSKFWQVIVTLLPAIPTAFVIIAIMRMLSAVMNSSSASNSMRFPSLPR